MEIKVIEEKKNKLVFELDSTHRFCNMLRDELNTDDKIKIATYIIKHPLVGRPEMVVETDGTEPRKVICDAANRLKKKTEKLENDFSKELK